MVATLMLTEIDWQNAVKKERQSRRDKAVIAVWTIIQRALGRSSGPQLIDLSEHGLDGQYGEDADLFWIEIRDDDSIMLEVDIHGNVQVPLESVIFPELEVHEVTQLIQTNTSHEPDALDE